MRVSRGITQDAEFEELGRRGYIGNLNDRQYSLLGNLGLRGALPDRIGASSISEYALRAVSDKLPPLVLDFQDDDFYTNNTVGSFAEVVDHSATSNATMTDSNGNIVWRPHNLLTYSEDFSASVWSKANTTVTANAAVAPDGTQTADKIIASTSVADHRVIQSNTSDGAKTFSAYIKPAGYSWAILQTPVGYAWFDVQNGVVGTETSITGSIEQAENGFYKCTVTSSSAASGVFSIWAVTQNGQTNYAGDGTSGIYLWGAHLYRSALGGMADVPASERVIPTATKYVPTTDAARYLPRRGHHVYNGSAWVNEGLLVESEARTNLVAYSEDFTSWTSSNSPTVTANATASPDGNMGGTALLANGTGGFQQIVLTPTLADNTDYCFSVFYKAAVGNSGVRLALTGKDGATRYFGALSDGSLSTPSGATNVIINTLGNNWYRLSGVLNSYSGATAPSVRIYMTDSTGGVNTMVSGDGIYIYGAQFEQGSTPSSYIPTNGSTVTRAAETLTIPAANLPWPSPVYVTGEELVTNGTFDTDSDWTKGTGWSISGGKASFSNPTGTSLAQVGLPTMEAGKVYLLSFDMDYTSGAGCTVGINVGGGIDTFGTFNSTATHVAVVVPTIDRTGISITGIGTSIFSLDNISVREIKPLSVSMQMDGRMTYADDGLSEQASFIRWRVSASDYINIKLDTSSTDIGQIYFQQLASGVDDPVLSASDTYSPDILVPFNISSRHGSTFINGAVDGVALTANTTPVALPDLSETDLELGYDFMGTIGTFRVWAEDIGDTGIEEATS